MSGRCVCPASHPYLFNGSCIECKAPKYWNHKNKACERCPDTFIFDKEK